MVINHGVGQGMGLDDRCESRSALGGGTVFLLGDAMASLDHEWDSSLRLMAAHGRRGERAVWVTCDDILIRGRTLVLAGEDVGPADLVWLRLDPSASVRWYETLRALCHVDARIINPPAAVLTIHDKRSALAFSPRDSFSVFSAGQLGPAIAAIRRLGGTIVVLKPPSLFGSVGVRFVKLADALAIRAAFDDLVDLFGYVIVEAKLGPPNDDGPPPDLRVLVTARRVLGVIERVIPLGGGLQPVKLGGPLSPHQAEQVGEVLAFLRHNRIVLAGLDFIGETLTEVNVSCPGAIPEINMFCGIRAEDMVLEDLDGLFTESMAI